MCTIGISIRLYLNATLFFVHFRELGEFHFGYLGRLIVNIVFVLVMLYYLHRIDKLHGKQKKSGDDRF